MSIDFSEAKGIEHPLFNIDVLNIIEDYNLWKMFFFVVENNSSNYAPYHGIRHTLHVVKAAHDIYWEKLNKECDLCDCDECAWDDFYATSEELVIAALFHDFNHSQGKLKDKQNVDNAIDSTENYLSYSSNFSYAKIKRITEIIRATEYPYSEENNINVLSEIIRDADLSQSASDDFLFYVMGLMEETNSSMSEEDEECSFKVIIENTIEFNKLHKFYLLESEKLFGEKRSKNIKMLEGILKQ